MTHNPNGRGDGGPDARFHFTVRHPQFLSFGSSESATWNTHREIQGYAPEGGRQCAQAIHVSGTVTWETEGRFFVQDGFGGISGESVNSELVCPSNSAYTRRSAFSITMPATRRPPAQARARWCWETGSAMEAR